MLADVLYTCSRYPGREIKDNSGLQFNGFIQSTEGGGGDTGCGKWDHRGDKMWKVGL